MRVRIFSQWGKIAEDFKKRYPDANFDFVDDDTYTHAVILNEFIPDQQLHTDSSNTIGIAMEPTPFIHLSERFLQFARQHIGIYYIGQLSIKLGMPFVNKRFFCSYIYEPKILPRKDNIMSIMCSAKTSAPGHKYRHQLVQAILNTNLPIHIYGRGCKLYTVNDDRLKGEFQTTETMLTTYNYHISIENYQESWYYSEKIIDPLLCDTVPLYLGCPNINEVFPGVPIIILTGHLDQDMETITQLCIHPRTITIDRETVNKTLSFNNTLSTC